MLSSTTKMCSLYFGFVKLFAGPISPVSKVLYGHIRNKAFK